MVYGKKSRPGNIPSQNSDMKVHHWRCLDVAVVRGAQCNTEYMMLRMKVQLGRKKFRSESKRKDAGKCDVGKQGGTRCLAEHCTLH